MRTESLVVLEELAARDERVVFLTGDLGYGVVESFFRRFPDRAFNVGVAEQNMVAMATGLAEAGLIPYVYSIATFATLRPFEFIRNGPVLHHLPVRIIGVGGGMEYSTNGPTHLALEDIGVLRTQPGLAIICPCNTAQARAALTATYDLPGPIYYRLSKFDLSPLAGLEPGWDGAGAHVLSEGDGSVALVALGAATTELAIARAELLAAGIDASTVAVSVVAPAPTEVLESIASRHRLMVVIESHHLVGGLGSLCCEIVAEAGLATTVMRCGVAHAPVGVVGSASYLARRAGIDGASVARRVIEFEATRLTGQQ
jgi:transketolase